MDKNLITQLGDELFDALSAHAAEHAPPRHHDRRRLPHPAAHDGAPPRRRRARGRQEDRRHQPAVMNMLGVFQPDFGFLTDGMIYNEGESSLALRYADPAQGRGRDRLHAKERPDWARASRAEQVLAATACVMPCFEIVDSRIRDWKIKIQDTVADNASCGVFVLGDRTGRPARSTWRPAAWCSRRTARSSAPAPAPPCRGIAGQCRGLAGQHAGPPGHPLKAGEVILSGSLAPLVPVAAGDRLRVTIGGSAAARRFVD
jgi:2-oxopent-4-enoate/cis-2-oxohex-4-enoate hydratase